MRKYFLFLPLLLVLLGAGCGTGSRITIDIDNECKNFEYSDWSLCAANGTQNRTIAKALPEGCTGGNPIIVQDCKPLGITPPPTCTDFEYSDWGDCTKDGEMSRTIIQSNPSGCSGGNPVLSQKCVYKPTCLHSSGVPFSATEESRMKEIMVSVMQGGMDKPTPTIYNEFWSIMDRHGRLCEEDIVLIKDDFAAATECTKLFYQDALSSLHTGQEYKSSQRLECENQTIKALLPADKAKTRIKANEDLMHKIATRQPIATARGNVVFTEEIIQSTLDDMSAKLERINKLFSLTPPNEEPSIHISRNPALDKECEKEHGPSVYKSLPKSIGGGAYCECKPEYTSEPIVTAEGLQSSWCVKE